MNDRTKKIYDELKNSYIGEKIEKAFNDQGKGLTEELINLYVYVIDADGPEELAGINKQYSVLDDILHNNFSDYIEIYNNLEAFLKKVLFIIDRELLEKYKKNDNRGVASILNFMGIIDNNFFDKTKQKTPILKIFSNIIYERNINSHESPVNSPEKIAELVWKTLFTEFWAISINCSDLTSVLNFNVEEEYEIILRNYLKHQVDVYEKIQEDGFKYIQIEYENSHDPEEDVDDKDSFNVVRGTADNLMQSINFEETPYIKLSADAGMGKTVMVEYINYLLSKEVLEDEKKVVPILINCNDTKGDIVNYSFRESIYNKIRYFIEECGFNNVSEAGFYGWLLDKYKAMFLIDGLNEINKSNSDKTRFVKSITDFIKKDVDNKSYFFITERYSRGAITLKKEVHHYKFCEITDEIKKQFFLAKGAETLFNRLKLICDNYDAETQRELNRLLKKPFYLSVFCEMADSFERVGDKDLPKNKQELMEFFIKELIDREKNKGEVTANYMYIRLYLGKMAELSSVDNRIPLSDVLKEFSNVTREYGLNQNDYSSDHIIELFEQLGFIRCSDDSHIFIDDIYSEFFDDLLLEML